MVREGDVSRYFQAGVSAVSFSLMGADLCMIPMASTHPSKLLLMDFNDRFIQKQTLS